jgi:hypothetical protein
MDKMLDFPGDHVAKGMLYPSSWNTHGLVAPYFDWGIKSQIDASD